MVVCQYFLRGQCAFGASCRNEHPAGDGKFAGPGASGSGGGGFGNKSWVSGRETSTNSNTAFQPGFTVESITRDWNPASEKPTWPLSSYGPAKFEPNLVSGLDESPEELRLKAWEALRTGQVAGYSQYESSRIMTADQQYKNALANVKDAFAEAYKRAQQIATGTSSAFGNTGSTTSAFGNTATGPQSAFGAPTSSFSNTGSAFGQPSATTSAFGQPSNPSSFIRPATGNAFGASGNSGPPTSAFGQSGFGSNPSTTQPQSAFATGGFGSSSGGGFGAFAGTGKVNAFGSGSPFGDTSGTMAFGTTSQPISGLPGPGQSAFGSTGSAFGVGGSGTATMDGSAPASVFGSNSTNTNPTGSAFGAVAPAFGSSTTPASAPGSVFGAAPPANTTNAFGISSSEPSNANTSLVAAPPATVSVLGGGGGSVFGSSESKQLTPAPTFGQSAFGGTSNTPSSVSAFAPAASTALSSTPVPSTAAPSAPMVHAIKFNPSDDPYIASLPPNYLEKLPKEAVVAFEKEEFDFSGKIPVPEWVPPIELR